MSRFENFIALRYLRSKRKEVFISIITVISVLGVAVSVLVLNMVLAIMTGFETELQAKLTDANPHIRVYRFGGTVDNYAGLIDAIRQIPGVEGAFPYTYSQAMISTPGGASGVLIRGVADDPYARKKLEKVLEAGSSTEPLFIDQPVEITRPDGSSDSVVLPPLIVGKALRERLGLAIGAPVTLFTPELASSPQGLVPKLKRFVVVGSYSSGLVEYESGLAYTSLPAAQKFFGLGEDVSAVEVYLKEPSAAPRVAKMIQEKLFDFGPLLRAQDWTEINRPLWDAIKLEKQVYFIVLLLLILIASFSIISTLVMVVMEKSRDIALLKTMGADDGSIRRIFLVQSSIIGIVGVILGTVLGYLGCIGLRVYGFPLDAKVFQLSQVPVTLEWENFAAVALAGLVITSLAGIYPAQRAAKLRPADALRFE